MPSDQYGHRGERNILIEKKRTIMRMIFPILCFCLGLTIGILSAKKSSSQPTGQSSNNSEAFGGLRESLTSNTESYEVPDKDQSTNHLVSGLLKAVSVTSNNEESWPNITTTPAVTTSATTAASVTTTAAAAAAATTSMDGEGREVPGKPEKSKSLDNEAECVPRDVYIRWSEIRKYLVKFMEIPVPDIGEGSTLKVRRCLYFMNPCNFGEAICFTSNQTYTEGNVMLTKGGKNFGQYKLVFVEDTECKCTNNTARKDQIDEPWYPPVIVQAKFIKFNISTTS